MDSGNCFCIAKIWPFCETKMAAPFPEIKSKNSLVAKYVTEDVWKKLATEKTKTSKFTLAKAIACAVQFDNQHCGVYAGDEDSYTCFILIYLRCSQMCSTLSFKSIMVFLPTQNILATWMQPRQLAILIRKLPSSQPVSGLGVLSLALVY